ncbi:DUF6361 family protein [Intrasporangium calvum]|uniref:Uncharacterized protein n=1 Tax=Intrasporangium calvum (strain ATCC 23552 / DSM 43043 / JCM 3097 / NBRC 12989 / NCIMB 10167 / NRRL B-3866 / 7 KIP) TaxID=710696 RepID=E6SC35_INTC7|nr:DUF6361 family protein [Intrasporangium calvum]ADU49575.1 hypothetical protein Intca_3089 [Intrasporangium calvum DSM 43043]
MGYFGWLDGDDSQRSAMLEVVKMFEDTSTVDELGIGSVRDTFSNAFFPGTSTLHTRVKYFLFVPWIVNDVARHRWPVERSQAELRSREIRLISALVAGGESRGVIGRDARSTLKRMPSELYWASLEQVGIRRWRTSINGYFRNAIQHARGVEDPELEGMGMERLGMAALPPAPSDLLDTTTFALNNAEAEFLKVRIADATRGSLFDWLAVNHPSSDADWIWDHERRDDFPDEMSELVDDARRVHQTATGPAILYNRMMAEVTGNDEVRDEYADYLRSWAEGLKEQKVFEGWDRSRFWSRMLQLNPRIRPATRQFLDTWWQLAEAGRHASEDARELVTSRELMLKRTRARLSYPDARSTWSVGAGTGWLDYRWSIARRHLNDLAHGLEG